MCYSAMVKQRAQKLAIQFSARIDHEEYDEIFDRRFRGEKILINKGMEYDFTHPAIAAWHEAEITRIEKEMFAQKKRLADAERSLKEKTTKKAENEQRIATNKIKKAKRDLEKHRSFGRESDLASDIDSEADQRIFPLHYASVICLDDGGEKVVRPMRYLMRPHDKDESFDQKFNGCYNARVDSLESVAWWRDSLEKRRGFIVISKFYENVSTLKYQMKNKLPDSEAGKENIVVCFEPDGGKELIIPVLWDVWSKDGSPKIYSFALITGDPRPEVAAAGHDRTPIAIVASAADQWLTAKDSKAALEVLKKNEDVHFIHRVMGAVA